MKFHNSHCSSRLFSRLDENNLNNGKTKAFFQQSGFEFIENEAQLRLTLNKVPTVLHSPKFTKCVVSLLTEHLENMPDFLTALCHALEVKPIQVLADAVSLLSETERLLNKAHQENLIHY